MESQLSNYSAEDILSMGSTELRNEIRRQDLHKKAGVSGKDLSQMVLADMQALAISGSTRKATNGTDRPREPKQDEIQIPASGSKKDALVAAIQAIAGESVDLQQVEALIDRKMDQALEQIKNAKPTRLEIVQPDTPNKIVEGEHHKFPLVFACMSQRINVALVGPAGSGKSTLCENAATALGLESSPMSFNALTSKADILGFNNATGFQESLFYKRFKHGGVFIADEFDAANAGIATILNAAIANRRCSFANAETVEAHKDFVFIAAMNTYGTGADLQYVGRNRLDAATLDRFAFINLGYDESIEDAASGTSSGSKQLLNFTAGGEIDCEGWVKLVRTYRRASASAGVKAIFSPRASIIGCQLIRSSNIGRTHLIEMLLHRGLTETDKKRITAEI